MFVDLKKPGIKSGRSCKLTANILERKMKGGFCGKNILNIFTLTNPF